MGRTAPLTRAEREEIYRRKLAGETLQEIAACHPCSVETVRKWWRRARDHGLAGLEERKPGPKPQGTLSGFDERVAQAALNLKRTHRRWGANRVLVELRKTSELQGLKLPSASRLAVYFKERCPEQVAVYHPRSKQEAKSAVSAVHEVWQLDCQENIALADGEIAAVCNVRDPFGAAIVASRAFATKTEKHWRKLDWTEVRAVLRLAFSEWQTLPQRVRTDNELCLGGRPDDPFPSKLTLWLCGLGVAHEFIRPHRPTDQAQVERNHRTLDDFTLDEESRTNLSAFQQALDRERFTYNHDFPARASDCQGKPPLQAHPELLSSPRPYRPECELALFDMQRVYHYLSRLTLERKVNANGVVSLGGLTYSVGHKHAGKRVLVRFDPTTQEWLFLENGTSSQQEIARRTLKELDIPSLTGLDIQPLMTPIPIQLSLPCLA